MKAFFYSTGEHEIPYLKEAAGKQQQVLFSDQTLGMATCILAHGCEIVSIFTEDDASADVLEQLYGHGVRYIAIRAAGYDNVDLVKAKALGMQVANVPDYSPQSVAEHAAALILALNRRLITADKQVRQYNFALKNLIGFDVCGKTMGIIGTGRIGRKMAGIMHGLGCRLLGYDIKHDGQLTQKYNLQYTDLAELCRRSDIISLHMPLTPETRHMVNRQSVEQMKPGVMLINTSRGACVNTEDILEGLAGGKIGSYGADVYENENGLFFHDHSGSPVQDSLLNRLLAFPNVLVTPHQAFATREALTNIATATFSYIDSWMHNQPARHQLTIVDFPLNRVASIDDEEL